MHLILDERDGLHDFYILPKPFVGETDPDALPVIAMSEAEVVQAIGRRVDGLAAADRFSGAVLVVKGDRELVRLVRGRAEQAFAADNRIDTRFNLGSMNKMFTAVAVAQLVERGKLSFTDSLARALPDYPNREFAGRVTLHQLLTHTSGIGGDIFAPPVYEHRDRFKRAADYIPLFADEPPDFPPGARFGYANPGFMTLGRIVEHASGEAYDDYVKTHIFAPAGMHATAAVAWDEVAPNLAVGYGREDSDPLGLRSRRTNVSYLPFSGTPAGGGYSTVLDLVAFVRALRGHVLLGEAMTETVTGPKVEAPMFGPGGATATAFGPASSAARRSAATGAGTTGSTVSSNSSPTAATSWPCSAIRSAGGHEPGGRDRRIAGGAAPRVTRPRVAGEARSRLRPSSMAFAGRFHAVVGLSAPSSRDRFRRCNATSQPCSNSDSSPPSAAVTRARRTAGR
ncbi:serine hydrolase domain-containing protein [Nannocystis pusilla]|uniref:serine hydrolase domain-containing protein n=1 Tax=Nannocystis pusilla TaxID=889268 RepID=UPI003B7FFB93